MRKASAATSYTSKWTACSGEQQYERAERRGRHREVWMRMLQVHVATAPCLHLACKSVCELALRSRCQDKGAASFVELTANHDRPVSVHEPQRSCSYKYAPHGLASTCCLSCRRSAPLSCTVIRAAPEIESWRTSCFHTPCLLCSRSTTPPLARHLDEQLLDERATTANKNCTHTPKQNRKRRCRLYCRRAGYRSWRVDDLR